jgi:WD40 repeat protein
VQRHLAFGGGGAVLVGEPAEKSATATDLAEPALPAPPADPALDRRSLADLHGTIVTMALAPGGRYLVTAGVTPAALVWDVGDLDAPTSEVAVTHTRWNDGDTPIRAVAVSPAGHLLATGTLLGAVGLFDFTDPTEPRPLAALAAHQQDVPGLAFHPDGHLLAVASQDHTVSLWDVTDPLATRRLATLHGHRQPARSVRFSPDGRRLVTGGRDATVLVWDVTRPEQPVLRHRLPSGTGWVYATAFDTTGDTLAVAGKYDAVTLWSVPDLGTPRRVARLKKDAAFTAAFSADGHLLATGHRQGAAIWDTTDLAAPVLLRRFSGYGPMATAEFHPAGGVLVTGGITGSLVAWRLDAVNPEALPPR